MIFGYFDVLDRVSWSPAPDGKYSADISLLLNYNYDVDRIGNLFKGYIFSWGVHELDEYTPTPNLISYLYIPNLIAAVALTYYTRNADRAPTLSIPEWLNWAGVDEAREAKASDSTVDIEEAREAKASDSTVDIDEAVGYGFDMLKGIAKYVIYVIILTAIGLIIIDESEGDGFFFLMGVPFIIAAIVIYISLAIGVMYKLWVDILARSRK